LDIVPGIAGIVDIGLPGQFDKGAHKRAVRVLQDNSQSQATLNPKSLLEHTAFS
jgi:hypothetical protein